MPAIFKHIRNYLLEKEYERLFLFVPVFLAIGISLYFCLNQEPELWATLSFFIICTFTVIIFKLTTKEFSLLLAAIWFVSAGFTIANIRTIMLSSPQIAEDTGTIWLRGTIEQLDSRTYGYRVLIKEPDLWQPDKGKFSPDETPVRIQLYSRIKQNEPINVGDYIQVKVIIKAPEKLPIFPESFDFGRNAYFKQIGGSGFTISEFRILEKKPINFTDRLKQILFQKIYGEGKDDPKSITYAMITGDDSNITPETKQKIRDAGLGHILAVSGLHMSIVMAGVFFLIRFFFAAIPRISLYYNVKKLAAIIVIIIGYYYLQLTNFPVSAERSYIMIVIFFLSIVFDRVTTTMRPVAIAGIILLIMKPEALFDAGFQMSFAAVASLIFLYEVTLKDDDERNLEKNFKTSWWLRSLKYLFFLIISSLIAGIATTPYSIYHFGRYSNYSILANLIAIPVSTYLIMPACFIAFIFVNTPLFVPLANMANITSDWLIKISDYATSLPEPVITRPFTPISLMFSATLCFAVLFFFKTRIRYSAIPFLLIIFYALFNYNNLPAMVFSEKKFAIRGDSGKYYFSNIRSSFSNNLWLSKLGQSDAKAISELNGCNSKRCLFKNIMILKGNTEQIDCNDFQYLVNLTESDICTEKTIINKHLLEVNGTHLVWLSDNGYNIKTVRDIEGNRPWNSDIVEY